MTVTTFSLWGTASDQCKGKPTITYYKPNTMLSNAAVLIFPGGGYNYHAVHEGKAYAEFLAEHGISAFVVAYRVNPNSFPLPLLDARRAVRFVRYHADEFGINKNKVAVMGSSAGGHLAALVSTYRAPLDGEYTDDVDAEEYLPNKQILCYPVINLYNPDITHVGSGDSLIGDKYIESHNAAVRRELTPSRLVSQDTPEAFIWHTFEDTCVPVENSLEYAAVLRKHKVCVELHLFPNGGHGMGLTKCSNALETHVAQWSDLLLRWLRYIGWLQEE